METKKPVESLEKSSDMESNGAKRKIEESERLKRERATRRLENKEDIKFKLPRFSGDAETLEQLQTKIMETKTLTSHKLTSRQRLNFTRACWLWNILPGVSHKKKMQHPWKQIFTRRT